MGGKGGKSCEDVSEGGRGGKVGGGGRRGLSLSAFPSAKVLTNKSTNNIVSIYFYLVIAQFL